MPDKDPGKRPILPWPFCWKDQLWVLIGIGARPLKDQIQPMAEIIQMTSFELFLPRAAFELKVIYWIFYCNFFLVAKPQIQSCSQPTVSHTHCKYFLNIPQRPHTNSQENMISLPPSPQDTHHSWFSLLERFIFVLSYYSFLQTQPYSDTKIK